VCEFVEGDEILSILEKKGAINEVDAKSIIHKVILGVKHMHEHKIIHRDLKLENIIVKYNKTTKQLDSIKIIDLGLGLKIDKKAKGFFGTPNYMPPEVFNKLEYDYKFDVFSIGVILYTMLRCDFPFNGDNLDALSFQIRKCDPNYHILTDAGVSNETISLIKGLLEKDSTKRLTLDEALKHECFSKQNHEILNINLSNDDREYALYSLRSYNKLNKLFKAFKILHAKIGIMNNNQLMSFRDLFLKHDVSNTG